VVSSHLMARWRNTADHLIVIGKGRLIADCTRAEFTPAAHQACGPDAAARRAALAFPAAGGQVAASGNAQAGSAPELGCAA